MGCCDSMVKYIVFFTNFVVFLVSVSLIIIGAYIQASMNEYLDFLGDQAFNTPIVIIIIGVVIMLVTFFGCCGAISENKFMIYTYSTLLTLLLIAMAGAAIAIYVYKDEVREVINKKMNDGMQNYGKQDHDGVTKTWNIVQHELKCCGVESYTDWKKADFGSNGDVPDECCIGDTVEGCGKGVGNESEQQAKNKIYTVGCLSKLETTIKDNVGIAAGAGIGLGVLVILAILVGCCVGRKFGRENEIV